jgi:starvation-inducible outer membrane lipoprotein
MATRKEKFMNRILLLSVVLALAACGKPEPAIESVESLVANPDRLRELRAACKADHAKVGDAQCNVVAEATRQRFMRASPTPYADDPVRSPVKPAGSAP